MELLRLKVYDTVCGRKQVTLKRGGVELHFWNIFINSRKFLVNKEGWGSPKGIHSRGNLNKPTLC